MMYLLSKLLKITVQNLRLRFGGPLVVSDLDGFEVLEDSTMQRLLCTSEDFGVPHRRESNVFMRCLPAWMGSVLITDEDVGLELHVAMRFLIVVIVIMRPRLVYSDCILKFLSFISLLFLVAVKIIDYDLPHDIMTEDFLAFILSRTLSAFIAHKVDDSLMVLVDSCSLVDQLVSVLNGINVDQKHRHDIPRHLVQQVALVHFTDCFTFFLSYVHYVALNKRFGKSVSVVACVWEDTSVRLASCLMTIYQRSSIIAMDVAYAGLAGGRISSIAINAVRCCYSVLLKNCHPCVEGAMHHDCPVCFEKTAVQYLFESRNDVIVMPCGHTIHKSCLKEMQEHYQYACPLCSKSVCDMSKVWEKFDVEIAATPMPELYQNKMVWILCNDCGSTSEVQFHIVGQKCPNCKSYNTRQTR
ncbi:hypothetical protein RHGRI_005398 [Rhododendron griersonianum]|uniref:RING-type domain-containing protein n=1 Tax=Rhododendron griersonianum TaxID=479676 RepID=A0AAV6LD50_9ERIC|nr:hypothetical protein RHGRI_005398 [Rhododendron griersonianum]